jgi:hypothetical protein
VVRATDLENAVVFSPEGQIRITLNTMASKTAAAEEYLHARTALRAVKRGESVESLQDTGRVYADELRTKGRLLGAADGKVFGAGPMKLDVSGLKATMAEYKARFEAWLARRVN